MPSLITKLTRLANINPTGEKISKKIGKHKKFFYGKKSSSKLSEPSNKVEIPSDKTLTIQISVFITKKQMGFYINEIRQQIDKKNK